MLEGGHLGPLLTGVYNPCDFFLWVYMKEKVYQPLPGNIAAFKRKARGRVWQKSIIDMKKRGDLMVGVPPLTLDGKNPVLEDDV